LKFEKSFLIKGFFVFFMLQFLFVLFININFYNEKKHLIKDEIKRELELCSYKLNCKNINVSFEKKDNQELLVLKEGNNSFYMYFSLSYLKKFYLKLSMSKKNYLQEVLKLKKDMLIYMIIELFVIIIFSLLFTYLLSIPLKKAYKQNETFIKDLLHDINTPLSSLKLNLFMLKKEFSQKRIEIIESIINNILARQERMKNYLD